MDLSFRAVAALVRHSLQDPRAAARHILGMGLPDSARWCLAGLVVTGSAILTHVLFSLFPPADTAFMADAVASPLRTAAVQAGALLITVLGVTHVGRWRGGTGSFRDALLLVGWLQFILLCLQMVQIVVFLLAAPLADVIGLACIAVSLWVLAQFIAQLHGFQSGWKVLAGVFATIFAAAFALSTIIVLTTGTGA